MSSPTVVRALAIGGAALALALYALPSAQARQEAVLEPFSVVDRRGDQLHPRLSGSLVVWQDYRDVRGHEGDELNADVYARDLAGGTEIKVSANRTSSHPDVSGELIVYQDNREGDADIRGYNLRTGESFWVARRAGSDQLRPAAEGSVVVWQDNRDDVWQIRARNLASGREWWLARSDAEQRNPRLFGRLVVWEEWRGAAVDVFGRSLDGNATFQVSNSGDAQEPDVSGEWVVYRRSDDQRPDIVAYSLATGERVRLNTSRRDARYAPRVAGSLVVWADRRNGEDFDLVAYDLDARQELPLVRAAGDQLEPAVGEGRVVWTETSADRGLQIAGANVTLPAPIPSPSPSPSPSPAPSPSPSPAPSPPRGAACPPAGPLPGVLRDGRYFAQTGYRVDHDGIWQYFVLRGGVRNFGYPVSRTVLFLGHPTQFFQRQVVQIGANGQPQLLNLLDEELMPIRHANFSTYPAIDPAVKAETPLVGDPSYATKIVEFTGTVAVDEWRGQPVRFFSTFIGQVTLADAFPRGDGDPNLLPLLNLELSGAPTSRPQADPANAGFIYQRFQRTILHYDAVTRLTQPVLLADHFKDVLMGRAPADLAIQMAGTRFANQYNPAQPLAVNWPDLLPTTDLCAAFEPQ